MTKDEVKAWVVQKASVTQPHGKGLWSASVTLGGMDINEVSDTIEMAYRCLATTIYVSKHYRQELERITN
jgi:hypothetical protein